MDPCEKCGKLNANFIRVMGAMDLPLCWRCRNAFDEWIIGQPEFASFRRHNAEWNALDARAKTMKAPTAYEYIGAAEEGDRLLPIFRAAIRRWLAGEPASPSDGRTTNNAQDPV